MARAALLFLAAAAILYLRLLYQADYFPPFHEGEQAQPLDAARDAFNSVYASHSPREILVDGHLSYNKGYVWALAPVYGMFGYDVRILTYAMPAFFAAYLGTMFILFRAAYPGASLLAYSLVAVMAVLCDCLRRTKWHTIAYVPPLAILVFFMPEWRRGLSPGKAGAARVAGLAAFALSCHLYFGCFLYAGPFALLLVHFGRRRLPRGWTRTAAAFLVFAAAAFAYFCIRNPWWSARIENEWGYLRGVLTRGGLTNRWDSLRNYYWGGMLSPPYLVMYAAGVAVLAVRAKRGDAFASIVCVLYGSLWVFQIVLEGANNPDQLNWSMIPALFVILAGAQALIRAVRTRLPAGRLLAALLVAVVAWREMGRFAEYTRDYGDEVWTRTRDLQTQAALVLRTISEDRSGTSRYFLPDPSVLPADGGFDYRASVPRPDFGEALSRVVFFRDEADLRRKILLGPRNSWAVVYLSVADPEDGKPDPEDGKLLGLAPEIVSPYWETYHIRFEVRKFSLRPGQLISGGHTPAMRGFDARTWRVEVLAARTRRPSK